MQAEYQDSIKKFEDKLKVENSIVNQAHTVKVMMGGSLSCKSQSKHVPSMRKLNYIKSLKKVLKNKADKIEGGLFNRQI